MECGLDVELSEAQEKLQSTDIFKAVRHEGGEVKLVTGGGLFS